MQKKYLYYLVIFMFFAALLTQAAGAYVLSDYDKKTNILTFSGTGGTLKPVDDNHPSYSYMYPMVSLVIIKPGVNKIAKNAFDGCRNLNSVIFSDGLEEIGGYSFAHTSLSFVEIPDSVTYIGPGAFNGNTNLFSVKLPKNLTSIENSLFQSCTFLESIELPENVTKIGNSAFTLSGLQTIVVPKAVTSIDENAFYQCTSLQSVILQEGLDRIGEQAFRTCIHLPYIILPEGITEIGSRAFCDCTDLYAAVLPGSLKYVGSEVFKGIKEDSILYLGCGSDAPLVKQITYSPGKTAIAFLNGGTIQSMAPQHILATPVRDGYVFDGWYTDEEWTGRNETQYDASDFAFYYAKWTKIDVPTEAVPVQTLQTDSSQAAANPKSPVSAACILSGIAAAVLCFRIHNQ